MLTVACVFKEQRRATVRGLVGSRYDGSWVDKLQRGVTRHLSLPHRFVCLTDTLVTDVETRPLVHDWDGWWSKIELFRPGLFDGPVLYMDLDTMIVGDLDALAGPHPSMVMLEDHLPGMVNSTCMWWDARDPAYAAIYETFREDVTGEAAARQDYTTALGDQALIGSVLERDGVPVVAWQSLLDPAGFVPFSFSSRLNPQMHAGTPSEARLVYCLGDPKFNIFPSLPVVAENWL